MTQQGVDVDPYIIGALLGDGCLTGTSSQPYISTNDKEIVDHFSKFYALKHSPNTYDYGISGGLVTQLKALGVWGTYSYDKKVPKDYLFNSKPVRLAVLRGLMDTDGYVDARGMHTVFYTTSTQLAEGVVFLVRSLGGKAKTLPKQTYYFQRGEKVAGRPGWAIMIRIAECPFALPRKANRWHEVTKSSPHRRLVSATDAGSRDCTCISVDSPDNTYVTKDFIVTHNTMACSFETTCHLIGWYPPWWEGFRFNRPIVAWASGEDTKAVRESLQFTFLGAIDHFGTGLIPKRNILGTTARSGVPEAIDAVTIKSNNGGVSRLLFKAYDQGRESFQAAAVDVMQFDEEPPANIYGEGLTRVLSTVPGQPNGLVICGFTPLKGLSEVVLSYMPGGTMAEGAVT